MSTSNPGAGTVGTQPQYALIAQALMDDIRRGRYALGDLLPPEIDLCTQFGVSRHTIREAMQLLIQRGLVSRQRGIGTHVAATEPHAHCTQSTASIADLPTYVEETRLVVQRLEDVIADEELADLLECPVGQRWLHANGSRHVGRSKEPIALTDVYVMAAYAGTRRRRRSTCALAARPCASPAATTPLPARCWKWPSTCIPRTGLATRCRCT